VYLIFKLLNISRTGSLSEDEFASVYDVISLKWKVLNHLAFLYYLFVVIFQLSIIAKVEDVQLEICWSIYFHPNCLKASTHCLLSDAILNISTFFLLERRVDLTC